MYWASQCGAQQAGWQESELETAKEKSQLVKVVCPWLGIHRLLARACVGRLEPRGDPGTGFSLECMHEAM